MIDAEPPTVRKEEATGLAGNGGGAPQAPPAMNQSTELSVGVAGFCIWLVIWKGLPRGTVGGAVEGGGGGEGGDGRGSEGTGPGRGRLVSAGEACRQGEADRAVGDRHDGALEVDGRRRGECEAPGERGVREVSLRSARVRAPAGSDGEGPARLVAGSREPEVAGDDRLRARHRERLRDEGVPARSELVGAFLGELVAQRRRRVGKPEALPAVAGGADVAALGGVAREVADDDPLGGDRAALVG